MNVGADIGLRVGEAIGFEVGIATGCRVGEAIGSSVGSELGVAHVHDDHPASKPVGQGIQESIFLPPPVE